jgi:hypothetical protein
MEKKFYNGITMTKEGHYIADATVVWCFDNRTWPGLLDFVKEKNFIHFDPILVAGGAKEFSTPENGVAKEFLLGQIEKSMRLHQSKMIYLVDHSACGAYGKHFDDAATENDFYMKELDIAREFVLSVFPDVKVVNFLMTPHGSYEW